jgi:hypothetical protein
MTPRHWCLTAFLGLLLGALFCPTLPISAGEARARTVDPLETIVVKGRRYPEPIPDEELERRVTTALHDDPFFYDEHVTVTVTNGIVHLEGFVLDDDDIRDALRIIRKKFPNAKRVVNELEVCRSSPDDG